MNSPFLERLRQGVLIADGAMGTMLHSKGLRAGECPELWNIIEPKKVKAIHRAYATANSELLTTNTFGASRLKLAKFGLESWVDGLNRSGVEIALCAAGRGFETCPCHNESDTEGFRYLLKENIAETDHDPRPQTATRDELFVAASIGSTGEFLEPIGDISVAQLEDVFIEQIGACKAADILWIESFADVREARVAVNAARSVTALPVALTFAFERGLRGERTMMGNSPEEIAGEFADVDVLGVNCASVGECISVAKTFRQCLPGMPLAARPNAGMPKWKNGHTIYPTMGDEFGEEMRPMFALVDIIGGCCGTTPAHVDALVRGLR